MALLRADSGHSVRSVSSRVPLIIGVLILLQLPMGRLVPGDGLASTVAREGVFWLLTAFLLFVVLGIERRPLSSLGLVRPTWKSYLFAVLAAAAMIAGMAAIYLVVFPALGVSAQEAPLTAVQQLPLWLQFGIVVRAAVFEELFYRGFAIERLTEITGLRWLAALLSLAAFVFAHLEAWGWSHLLVAAFGGIVLTGLYLLRRDLASNMIAHFLTDAIGFLIA